MHDKQSQCGGRGRSHELRPSGSGGWAEEAGCAGFASSRSRLVLRERESKIDNRKSDARSRGAVLVETALMIPILLLLTLGMIEFGFYFFVQHQLQGAAREGARSGIVMNAETEDVEAAVARALGFESIAGTPFQLSVDQEAVESGEEEIRPLAGVHLRVVVSARWDEVGVRPMRLISADRRVQGRAVMRMEEGTGDGDE